MIHKFRDFIQIKYFKFGHKPVSYHFFQWAIRNSYDIQ